MTKEEAKELLPIIQAYAEGKPIQIKGLGGQWTDVNYELDFNSKISYYRIKPETKLRPYATPEEFLQAMKEHGPYLCLGTEQYYLPIMIVRDNGIVYSGRFKTYFKNYEELIKLVWQDNTPCGILEP